MPSIRWLHLADHRQGMGPDGWPWPTVQDQFYEDLARLRDNTGSWDLVLSTGDLTQRADPAEFQPFDRMLEDHLHRQLERLERRPRGARATRGVGRLRRAQRSRPPSPPSFAHNSAGGGRFS
jgi:hypothetical protein